MDSTNNINNCFLFVNRVPDFLKNVTITQKQNFYAFFYWEHHLIDWIWI